MNYTIELPKEELEDLIAEHARLKKELGPNHFLVQRLWSEIRMRRSENRTLKEAGTESIPDSIRFEPCAQ